MPIRRGFGDCDGPCGISLEWVSMAFETMSQRASYIGIKDFFTLINALGGVGAIVLTAYGLPQYGVISIFLGFICGDALDGYVARKTGTANKFGAEFDSASDQLSEGIAPAVVVAGYFAQQGHLVVGAFVTAAVALAAVLRVARFATAQFPVGSAYYGLPRVGVGIMAAGLPYSYLGQHVFSPELNGLFIVFFASLSLLPIPFVSHKGRKLRLHAKVTFIVFLIGAGCLILYRWTFLIDFLVLSFFIYVLFGWTGVRPDERKKFYQDCKDWSLRLSAK